MRKYSVILTLSLLLALPTLTFAAQEPAKPLANADIVQMVQAGLSAEIILKAITSAPATAFDVTPAALVSLKNASVSDAIVSAMLDASAKKSLPAAAEATPDPTAGMPKHAGVYYKHQNEWKEMQGAPYKYKSKGLLGAATGVGKMRVLVEIRGANAPVQFAEPPVFYVRGMVKPGSTTWMYVLEQKKDSREIQVASGSALRGSSSAPEDKTMLAVTMTLVSDDVLMATPQSPLSPGEYLISVNNDTPFDFGIAGEKK